MKLSSTRLYFCQSESSINTPLSEASVTEKYYILCQWIFPLIGTGAEVQMVWSLASMQTLQKAQKLECSRSCVFQCSFKLCGDLLISCERVWSVKLWHSCHHEIFNCFYWTDSSSSQGVEVVEKPVLSVSNWATWSNTSSLWRCSACGRSLAESGNMVGPSLVSDRRILFIHGQLKKCNNIKTE